MTRKIFQRYLLAGLLVWLPVLATVFVLSAFVDTLDKSLALLPKVYQPENLLGFKIPGFGVLLSLATLFFTGMMTTHYFGRHLVEWGEKLLARIPLARTIYHAVKQVLETLFSSNSRSFRHVVLVEYPRKGIWSIAFETGTVSPNIQKQINNDEDMLTIFLPTTPNPTSGFLMMVPRKDTRPLDMSIDEALKLVISLGVVQPADKNTTHTQEA